MKEPLINNVSYRQAVHEDLYKLLDFETLVWGSSRDDSDLALLIKFGYVYLATIKKKIVGYILAIRSEDVKGDCLVVMSWAVHSDFRKHGIGQKLYQFIFEKEKRVMAYVRTTNDPSSLAHIRMGFSIVDTIQRSDSIAWLFERLPTL